MLIPTPQYGQPELQKPPLQVVSTYSVDMPLISITVEIMLGERVMLTFHVMLQLDKIHRSQRSFCVIRGGHADQLDEQREKTMSVAEMTGRRTTPGPHVNLRRGRRNKEAGFRRIGPLLWR